MKIVLLVVGLPFIVLGLFLFGQGVGLFSGPHNAVLIDAGAGVVAGERRSGVDRRSGKDRRAKGSDTPKTK
jgi:hypothetical protein